MKKAVFVAVVVIMMLLTNKTKAGVSVVVNGSFEYDGRIDNIIIEKAPQRWCCDVNFPSDKFGGWVKNDWSTYVDGGYSLTLYSKAFQSVEIGDIAIVSQQVYLEDVNHIFFDIKLGTEYSDIKWDPNERTAVLLIDGDEVWNSDDLEPNEVVVDDKYKDANSHTLSLAIRADVDGLSSWQYWAQWDFVRFDAHCEGFGYLPEDLNQDCYVNMFDLEILAQQWLEEAPAYKYDLFEDGIVDFLDFAVLANRWMGDSFGYEQENKLLAADFNNDGIVDFRDFAILAKDWDCGEFDYDSLSILADEWLQKSWLYGLE